MSDQTLGECIEALEGGYEFLLAYAAQGFDANQAGGHTAYVRRHLESMSTALARLSEAAQIAAEERDGPQLTYSEFLNTLRDDARKASGVLALVLAREGISSQIIDNFNASSHIRTLLTDLFLLDEALR